MAVFAISQNPDSMEQKKLVKELRQINETGKVNGQLNLLILEQLIIALENNMVLLKAIVVDHRLERLNQLRLQDVKIDYKEFMLQFKEKEKQ